MELYQVPEKRLSALPPGAEKELLVRETFNPVPPENRKNLLLLAEAISSVRATGFLKSFTRAAQGFMKSSLPWYPAGMMTTPGVTAEQAELMDSWIVGRYSNCNPCAGVP